MSKLKPKISGNNQADFDAAVAHIEDLCRSIRLGESRIERLLALSILRNIAVAALANVAERSTTSLVCLIPSSVDVDPPPPMRGLTAEEARIKPEQQDDRRGRVSVFGPFDTPPQGNDETD